MSIHISAKPGEIAKTVLIAGDPLRAKFIAERYLQDIRLVSSTRNVYFFTGTHQDKELTIGASGMGCPSIGIYSYELYTEYEADCIIRIGTCGAYTEKLKLFDLINVDTACSESTYAECAYGYKKDRFKHRGDAFDIINATAAELGLELRTGTIHSGDVFYRAERGKPAIVKKYKCLAAEMEAFALFANARYLKKSLLPLCSLFRILLGHIRRSLLTKGKRLCYR